MSKFGTSQLFLVLVALMLLAGCVQFKPIPKYARAGDNIVVGLGGIQRNAAGATVLRPADLTITLTDANAVQHNLVPLHVFQSFPDYGAVLNAQTLDGTNAGVGLTNMVPYDGGWFVVVPLTYPGQPNNPLPLAVGAATVSVTSPKLLNTATPLEGNLSAIPLQILAGTSPADGMFTAQFTPYLTNQKSFEIRPADLSGIDVVGGAHLVIQYNDDTFFTAGRAPVLVPAYHNPYVQLNYHVVPNGNGSGAIHVTLLNPAGFKTPATASANSSLLSDLAVKLIYFSGGTAAQAKANFSVDTFNSYYVDLDGAVLPTVTPTLTHNSDL